MRKLLEIGGVIAAVVLIALGIVTVVLGFDGRSTVNSSLKQEYIVGAPDMTPEAIKTEAADAKLPESIALPTCDVAGEAIDSGTEARCFGSTCGSMRWKGQAVTRTPRWAASRPSPEHRTEQLAVGGGTDNPTWAAVDPRTQQPISNPARNLWVTETALATALNASYMADRISLFGIVVGITLLITGIGFGILAVGGALRSEDSLLSSRSRRSATETTT